MDPNDREKLKSELLRLRDELEQQDRLSGQGRQTVELDQSSVGRLSRMDAMQSQQMSLELARRRTRQRLEIDAALKRMTSGEYGECRDCGDDIDVRRLCLDPAMTRCVTCAGRRSPR